MWKATDNLSPMMHLTFADKSLVLGTEVAELVVEYAATLARAHSADTIKLAAYGADGDKVEATLLLDEGAPLMIETATTDLPEPDNTTAVEYMTERTRKMSAPSRAMPIGSAANVVIDDLEREFDFNADDPTAR
jgi:hypothetical protein